MARVANFFSLYGDLLYGLLFLCALVYDLATLGYPSW